MSGERTIWVCCQSVLQAGVGAPPAAGAVFKTGSKQSPVQSARLMGLCCSLLVFLMRERAWLLSLQQRLVIDWAQMHGECHHGMWLGCDVTGRDAWGWLWSVKSRPDWPSHPPLVLMCPLALVSLLCCFWRRMPGDPSWIPLVLSGPPEGTANRSAAVTPPRPKFFGVILAEHESLL